MKNFRFLAVAAMALSLTGCYVHITSSSGSSGSSGYSDSDLKAVTNVVQRADFPTGFNTLEVDNRSGPIHIAGTKSESIGWTWTCTIRARTDAVAQQLAEATHCNVERDGNRFKLTVVPPDSKEPHSLQSALEITVPESISVRTYNRYGPTRISDLEGNVEANGQSGAVEIQNIGGKVLAQTSYATLKASSCGPAILKNQSGAIEAADIRGPLEAETSYASLIARDIAGPIHLRNQSGRIEAEQAGSADIKTSYADLKVKGINGDAHLANQSGRVNASGITGSVTANTSYAGMDIEGAGPSFVCNNQSGSISVQATSPALANLEAKTSYAALEVRLPAELKPAVQARTSYAEVESDFPVLLKPRGQDPFTEVPSGTPRINLQNQSGKIRITNR